MVTDTAKLEYHLKKANVTKKAYAKKLGISLQGLYNKLNNSTEFKQAEIVTTCTVLTRRSEMRFFLPDR